MGDKVFVCFFENSYKKGIISGCISSINASISIIFRPRIDFQG
jgi:hypothetical protein